MGDLTHYVIRGGVEGRERLRVISRVMNAGTSSLFERLGIAAGASCLDVGCGGGDVTVELARRVGPRGRAVGIDSDAKKIELARQETGARGLENVEFRVVDVREHRVRSEFDIVYARFLLTHLPDPGAAVETFYRTLRPGGLAIVEDIDFSGYFVFPESPAFREYQRLYCEVVRRRGGDPNIGPRLPALLKHAGFVDLGVSVTQPVGLEGEVKLINVITMENIADAVLQTALASREEIAAVVQALYDFAADPGTLASVPRVVQAWGRRPPD